MELWDTSGYSICGIHTPKDVKYFQEEISIPLSGWRLTDTISTEFLYQDIYELRTFTFVVSLGLLMICLLATFFAIYSQLRPLFKLKEQMQQVMAGNLNAEIATTDSKDEISSLSRTFNNMVTEIGHLIEEIQVTQKRESELRFEMLLAQINPHFLYNSLNIINWVCLKGEQENASKMLLDLSRMLQYTSQNGDVLVPLWADLDWLKRYIGIMQKRYQDQFEVSMDIPEYLRSLEVPKLFLQPFVENAIVHGFKNYQDSGKIWISAEEEENDILFYVEDNGCGICEEDLKEVLNKERKSIGVRNTNKRIRMIYGEKYGVTISSQLEEGTVVTIRLPLKVNSKKQS